MQSMKQRIALGLLVAAAAGVLAAPAFAERSGGCFDGKRFEQRMEKRQQALHDDLKLTAEQEKGWKTYSDAVKAAMPKRGDFDRNAMAKLTAPERADKMLARGQERLEGMRKATEAMKVFYATLTPEQKKVFDQKSFHGLHGKPDAKR